MKNVLLFLNKCSQMDSFYKFFNFHKIIFTSQFLSRCRVVSFILISFIGINNLEAQTQITPTAPLTLTYSGTATLPPCGSNGVTTDIGPTPTAPARAAAMNTAGLVINIPAANGNYASYATRCLYWGFTNNNNGGFSINTTGTGCGTPPNNFNFTPSISGGTTLTISGGSTTLQYYNGATASTIALPVRMRIVLSAGNTWRQYGNYFLVGPLNTALTATIYVEAQYPFATIAASAASGNPVLCGTHAALTNGAWYPALWLYDQINTNTGYTACTSIIPWFYYFDKPTMTSTATKTTCSGSAIGKALTASVNSSFHWTVVNNAPAAGGTADSCTFATSSLNQTLTNTTGTAPATVVYTITPRSGVQTSGYGTCTGTAQTFTDTVNPVAKMAAIGPQSVCPGDAFSAQTFSTNPAFTGGTISYAWTNNNTAIGLAASGTGDIASFNGRDSANVSVAGVIAVTPSFTNNNVTCPGTNYSPVSTLTVKPRPTVAVDRSTQSICSGFSITSIDITNPNSVAGTTFSWVRTNSTGPTGIAASGSTDPITGTLTNTNPVQGGTQQTTVFTVTATANSCTSTTTSTVIVNPKPDTAKVNGSSLDFTISFCGTGQLVSSIVRNDTTVKYFDSLGTTLLATGSVYNVTTPGLYKVMTYNITTGCYSDTVDVRVFLTAPFSTTVTKSNYNGYQVSCNGGSNGSITVAASTSAYPVIYTWSTGRTRTINSGPVRDSIIGTLAAGTYYISMSDASGCGKVDTVVLTSPPALGLTLAPSSFDGFGTSCNGSNTGSINATPSGGYGTYGYSWTSTPAGFTSTSGNISSLYAKTYNLTVTDGNGCTIAGSSVITDPNAVSFTYSIGYECSGSTYTSATVTINASGGASGNYEYKMDAGAWQSSNQFTGLANSSSHTFQVRDASYTGCLSGTQNFTITFPPNGTSVGDCNFIYVTTSGAGNLGSKACPANLDSAFAIFSRNSLRNHILLGSGTYTFNNTTITIPGGVVIDGGYNTSTWIKSTATPTIFNITPALVANAGEGHYTGIILNGNNISLRDLTINVLTGGATGTTAFRGRSIYGIYSNSRTGFLISRCAISTGSASAGYTQAAWSGSGSAGGGGAGGSGGNVCAYGCGACGSAAPAGTAGSGGGGAGGSGGSSCCASGCNWYGCDASGCNAGNGGNGTAGSPGTAGAAAAANTTGLGVFYTPVDGNDGTNGKGGGGGGRGGEGASGTCCTCTCGPYCAVGGSGGRGGDGGLGGLKGYGGGSSFDIYVYGGSGVVTDCFGSVGAAGAGGTATAGQPGTAGSGGSAGGDNTGYCDGGRGGAGGTGGNGSNGATGISTRLQSVSASVSGSGISASVVPTDGTVTVDWKRGCTKSQIDLTKTSGSAWTGISSNPAFVLNQDSATTSYGTGTSNPSIYYTTAGVKNLSLGTTTLSNFISIYDTRLVDPVTSVMNAISPNMICPTASISLGTGLSAGQIANITDWSWEISKVSDPFTNVYTSNSSAPGTVAAPSGGWEPGELYQVRLELKELCCGWSIPIYRSFRIYPVLAQPTITAVPSGTVCQNSTIKYYTAVSGATTYTWTVTGGTVVPGVTSDTIYVTWPTATTGTVSVVPKNACTPNTDGPVRTINVPVNAIPSVSVTNTDPTICRPGSTTLTANAGSGGGAGNGSFTYIWSPGGATSNPLTVTPGAAGTYTYTVQVTEGGSGCKVVSPVITITADDAPTATPALTKLYACDPSAVLTASSITSGASIIWLLTSGTGTPASSSSNPLTVTGLTSGATSIYDLLISKGNCDSLDMGSVSITAPSAGTTTIATTSSCDYCVITDGSTKSFYNSLGHIIATIVDDAAVTPAKLDTTEVCVGMMAYTATTVPTVYTSFGDYQPYLPRRWSVKPLINTKSHVILYFKAAEVNALQTAAIGTDYQFSNPTSDLVITKFSGGTAGTFTNPPVFPATNSSAVLIFPVVKKYPNITTGPDYSVEFDVTTFSTFYLHPNQFPFAPLPVELVSFIGWNQGRVNQLQWVTASEQNTLRFEIEKSTNATNWVMIGSKPAAGNSTQTITYSFTDNNPVVGFNYYRLKIIDTDGTISYSKIIDINLTDVVINGFVNIYPNPTTGGLNVDIQSTVNYNTTITVYDVLGSIQQENAAALKRGLNALQFDFSALAKGTYLLKYMDNNGKMHTEEFVKN